MTADTDSLTALYVVFTVLAVYGAGICIGLAVTAYLTGRTLYTKSRAQRKRIENTGKILSYGWPAGLILLPIWFVCMTAYRIVDGYWDFFENRGREAGYKRQQKISMARHPDETAEKSE